MKPLLLSLLTWALAFGLLAGCNENRSDQRPPARTTQAPLPLTNTDTKIRTYQDVLKNDPGNLQALIGIGNIYMDSKQYPQAISHYEKALKIQPENVDVRVDMGTCYRNIDLPGKAVAEYKMGLTYQPNHANALANLGVVLAYDMKDPNGAVETWEKFLKVAPTHQMADHIRQEISRIKSVNPQ